MVTGAFGGHSGNALAHVEAARNQEHDTATTRHPLIMEFSALEAQLK